jgi:transcriptional regulator with XRE-family HTH domain
MTTTADRRPGVGPDRYLTMTGRIRDRRRSLGLTQKQVVTRLAAQGVCSTNKALSSLEHGAGIDVGKLPELAAALDCTVTYLLGLTDDPASWQPERSSRWGAQAAHLQPEREVAGAGQSARLDSRPLRPVRRRASGRPPRELVAVFGVRPAHSGEAGRPGHGHFDNRPPVTFQFAESGIYSLPEGINPRGQRGDAL